MQLHSLPCVFSFPRFLPSFPSLAPATADELLEQFLESFPEETAQVQLQLMTATVKLFLKKPVEKPQQLIQLVLTYATQVSMGFLKEEFIFACRLTTGASLSLCSLPRSSPGPTVLLPTSVDAALP